MHLQLQKYYCVLTQLKLQNTIFIFDFLSIAALRDTHLPTLNKSLQV